MSGPAVNNTSPHTKCSTDITFGEDGNLEHAIAAQEPAGYYLYGIVAADHSPLPQTVAAIDPRWPIQMFGGDRVHALVSKVPLAEFAQAMAARGNNLAWIETKLRAHDGVLKAVVKEGPLVPFRFGTLLPDECQLSHLLAEHQERFVLLLEKLADKSEWGVKLFHRTVRAGDSQQEASQSASDTAAKELKHGHGLSYLREQQRRQQSLAEARQAVWSAVHHCHESLSSIANGEVTLPLHNHEPLGLLEEMLLNATYLVDRMQLERFHQLVEQFAQQLETMGLRLECSGPWPPYNFTNGLCRSGTP